MIIKSIQEIKPATKEISKIKKKLMDVRNKATPIDPIEQPTRQMLVETMQFFQVSLSYQSIKF
jgi:hypothetical protein